VDLHRGGFGAQVEVAHQRGGVERAGVDHLARGETAQLDLRLALGKSARRGISQRAVNTGGAVITSSAASPFSRIISTAAARESKPSRSFGRQARAASVSVTPRPGAAEQFHTEVFLERLYLVADCRLRDVQLIRGVPLERQMARGGPRSRRNALSGGRR
jgi:hypothetical protein